MKMGAFWLTLGLGMAAGSMAVLMLPQQSQMRKNAQKAANKIEHSVTEMMQ